MDVVGRPDASYTSNQEQEVRHHGGSNPNSIKHLHHVSVKTTATENTFENLKKDRHGEFENAAWKMKDKNVQNINYNEFYDKNNTIYFHDVDLNNDRRRNNQDQDNKMHEKKLIKNKTNDQSVWNWIEHVELNLKDEDEQKQDLATDD